METVKTPVNWKNFNKLLKLSNFDRKKRKFIIKGFRQGFKLQYTGDRNVKMTAPNLKLTVGSKTELWNKVMNEVKLGRFAGPYEKPPFDNFVQSPIGLVPKDGGRKTRLIFHLSYPRNSGKSVNSNTDPKFCTVKYKDFDDAIRMCIETGKGCYLGKSDFTAAFRNLGIHPSDWHLLVMKAENPQNGKTYYFIDKCLPFGHSISCYLFQEVSDAIEHILAYRTKKHSINYLDDFLIANLVKKLCNDHIQAFLDLCEEISFPSIVGKDFLGYNTNHVSGTAHRYSTTINLYPC